MIDWNHAEYCAVLSALWGSAVCQPFTADDPLVSKWCNAKLLQIYSNEELNSSTSFFQQHFQLNFIFGWTCQDWSRKMYTIPYLLSLHTFPLVTSSNAVPVWHCQRNKNVSLEDSPLPPTLTMFLWLMLQCDIAIIYTVCCSVGMDEVCSFFKLYWRKQKGSGEMLWAHLGQGQSHKHVYDQMALAAAGLKSSITALYSVQLLNTQPFTSNLCLSLL